MSDTNLPASPLRDALKAEARRCRRLALSISDSRTIETLRLMAAEYEDKARALQDA